MLEELQLTMLGDEERLGNLMRYSKQITIDAMNQFNATYNETVANDLGLEWYYYSGANRSTSRSFCKKYSGKYYHKEEVKDFASERWEGKIPATNESSIFKYRGGWNCRHVFKPTTINSVPKSVINRAKKKGYYKET